jgi:hypothetical protein
VSKKSHAHGHITPTSDREGVKHELCIVSLFDERKKYTVANAPADKADLQFDGADLNYLARVVYAEASGTAGVGDKAERMKEKSAIIHVMYNRLIRVGFDPNNWVKGKFTTFRGVAGAVRKEPKGGFSGVQFEAVIGTDGLGTSKFKSTAGRNYENFDRASCLDFEECFVAVKAFIEEGVDANIDYDNFRATGSGKPPKGQVVIGGNRFWKMK